MNHIATLAGFGVRAPRVLSPGPLDTSFSLELEPLICLSVLYLMNMHVLPPFFQDTLCVFGCRSRNIFFFIPIVLRGKEEKMWSL